MNLLKANRSRSRSFQLTFIIWSWTRSPVFKCTFKVSNSDRSKRNKSVALRWKNVRSRSQLALEAFTPSLTDQSPASASLCSAHVTRAKSASPHARPRPLPVTDFIAFAMKSCFYCPTSAVVRITHAPFVRYAPTLVWVCACSSAVVPMRVRLPSTWQ